jgi:hypothetical protein
MLFVPGLIRKGNWKMSKRKLKRDQNSAAETDKSSVVIGIDAVPKGKWKILGDVRAIRTAVGATISAPITPV